MLFNLRKYSYTRDVCVGRGVGGGEEVCEGSIVCVYKEGVRGVLYS